MISILVGSNKHALMSMSSRFYHPPGMQADSHPALLYEALLPFLSKEVIRVGTWWAGSSLEKAPTVQPFFQGSTKKPFPETGKDFMVHSFKGIVLTLSCFKKKKT